MSLSKKNVLFLLHLPPPVHGSSIVGEQVKNSNIINSSLKGRYINLILSRKVNESGKASPIKMIRFVMIWLQLLGALLVSRPNLCYYALTTTGAGFYKDVLLIGLIRLFNVRTVYHIHNRGIKEVKSSRINYLLYKFVFNEAHVILLSKHLYYDIETYVSEDRVYYCPNGISEYEPSTVFLNLSDKGSFNILFLSNLMEQKGVFVLIESCAILKAKGYQFQCNFVGGEGDISEKQFNQFVQEKELTEDVKYWGKRYGQLKDMSFEQSDVFVLPTACDCFPLVILEAMQHSLPVITTTEGGIPDMVDEGTTGFMLPQYDDAIALAEKIEFLFLHPELRKTMGLNGRVKYQQNFTLSMFEQQLNHILSELSINI